MIHHQSDQQHYYFLENNLRFPFSKVDKQEARNNTSKFEE